MKETRFIEQNKEKWADFERLTKSKRKDADRLSELFVQLSDDLSYARTFYPRRSVRVYLNNQVQKLFVRIYRNRRMRGKAFAAFWTRDLPQVMWHSRRELLISFLLTVMFIGIGIFSSVHDSDFARVILGERYVRMTEANIESGDPMAVYKQAAEFDMFLAITFNNLRVDLLTFITGVFFGIGTLAILLQNGIMIGAFQYFFIERGLFWPSFLTIFQHGTLEVSAMVISGAAGLALGRGLLFPGTYTRLQAFQYGAIRALKIFAGIVPVTIMAGFIEAFMTRYTDMPDVARVAIIVLSLGFILFYYVILPRSQARRGFAKRLDPPELRPSTMPSLEAYKLRSTGEAFTETFRLLRRYLRHALLVTLACAAFLTGALLLEKDVFNDMNFSWTLVAFNVQGLFSMLPTMVSNLVHLFDFDLYPRAALFLLPVMSILLLYSFRRAQLEYSRHDPELGELPGTLAWLRVQGPKVLVITALFLALGFLPGRAGWIFTWLLLPVFFLWAATAVLSGTHVYQSLLLMFGIVAQRIGRLYSLYFVLLLVSMLLLLVIGSPLSFLYIEFLKLSLPETILRQAVVFNSGYVFLISTVLLIAFQIMGTGSVILYFTLRDISEALSLQRRIDEFASRR